MSIDRALSMLHPSGGQWLVVHVHHRLERMGDVGGVEGTVEEVGLHHGAGSQLRRHAEHHMAARVPRPDGGGSSEQDDSFEESLLKSIFSDVSKRNVREENSPESADSGRSSEPRGGADSGDGRESRGSTAEMELLNTSANEVRRGKN